MKTELKKVLKLFFNLKTINCITIRKSPTKNNRFIVYTIVFLTINK